MDALESQLECESGPVVVVITGDTPFDPVRLGELPKAATHGPTRVVLMCDIDDHPRVAGAVPDEFRIIAVVVPVVPDIVAFSADHAFAVAVLHAARRIEAKSPIHLIAVGDRPGRAGYVARAHRLLGWFPSASWVDAPVAATAAAPPRYDPSGEPVWESAVDRQLQACARDWADGPADRRPPRGDVSGSTVGRPLVSVIIPFFNGGVRLERAVASVRSCGHRSVEIVVVDDGSTDEPSRQVFDRLSEVVKIRQRHQGLPSARNAALAAARGDYILPLDADDVLVRGFVPEAVRVLEGHARLHYVSGFVRNTGLRSHLIAPVGMVGPLSVLVNTFARATALFRRDSLRAIDGYAEMEAYEDWDLYLRLEQAGFTGEVLPILAQEYLRHEGSMTMTMDRAAVAAASANLVTRHVHLLDPPSISTLAWFWRTGFDTGSMGRRAAVPTAQRPEAPGFEAGVRG